MKFLFSLISIFFSLFILFTKSDKKRLYLFLFLIIFLPPNIIILNEPIQITSTRFAICSLLFSTLLKNKDKHLEIPKEIKLGLYGIFIALLLVGLFDTRLNVFLKIYRPTYIFIENFFLAGLIYLNIKKYEEIISIYKFLMASFFIISIYGLFNYFTLSNPYYNMITSLYGGVNYFESYLFDSQRMFRINSFIIHPITYGFFCLLVIIIIVQYIILHKTNYKMIILILLLVINLLLTNSRTPILAMLIAIILYFFLFNIKNRSKLLLISLLLLIIAMQLNKEILLDSINIFRRTEKLGGSSLDLRYIQLISSYQIFSKNPIFGNGINYITEGLGYRTEEYNKFDKNLMGVESYIFYLLIEEGISGLLGNLFYFSSILIYFIKRRNLSSFVMRVYSNSGILMVLVFLTFMISTGELYSFKFAISLIAIQLRATNILENTPKNVYEI